MNRGRLNKTEWKIIVYVFILLVIGLTALYSATTSTEFEEFKKQIIWIILGISLLLVMFFLDYRIISRFSPILYGASIVLLVVVLLTGKINGASSWFNIGSFSMQPAEFSKIAVVIFLASIINNLRTRKK